MLDEQQLVRLIDQTIVAPERTETEMKASIQAAREQNFHGVAIMPVWVPLAASLLEGSRTGIVAAIGYPLGTTPTKNKIEETEWVLRNAGSCDVEFDMVMNISYLKMRQYQAVREDIQGVVEAATGRTVKVIIEAPLLSDDEIVIASLLTESARAHFVKTSTGFVQFANWRPVALRDIRCIASAVGGRVKIKASGKIKTFEQMLPFIEAGCDRIGTSAGFEIYQGYLQMRKLFNHQNR
jgi:deoxyribose-phosphate aldolase